MAPSKRKWQILFLILLSAAGFFIGGAVGKLSIPAGSGLAGPAILLGYLAAGAGIALVIGILLGMKLKGEHMRQAAFAALILLILAIAALFLIPKKKISSTFPNRSSVAPTSEPPLRNTHEHQTPKDVSKIVSAP